MFLMIILAISPILLMLFVNLLLISIPIAQNLISIVTKGKYAKLHDTFIIALAHLIEKPEEWMIKSSYARFPKTGNAFQIVVDLDPDNDKDPYISIHDVENGKPLALDGYFIKMFEAEISKNHNKRSTNSVIKSLYPDRLVMLEDKSAEKINLDANNEELDFLTKKKVKESLGVIK